MRKGGLVLVHLNHQRNLEREWDRERGMDFDLMPPPGSSKKAGTSMDVDQMIDPNEPMYCICHQVSFDF